MTEPLDVLAVMAHPDDAEMLCGGALIKAADRGERAGVVDLTRGESGSFGTADLRAEEAEEAARIMGLAVRRNAGLPDAALVNTPETRRTVAALVRALRPATVVTHWIRGRHPDHRVAAELVYDACYLAGLSGLDAPGDPWRPRKVVHATAFREDADPPSFVVDVTDQMDRKIEAMAAFGSQFGGKSAMGEVFSGGDRSLYDQVRTHCARYGSLIRVAYGEPFRARETFAVESLADPGVSTF